MLQRRWSMGERPTEQGLIQWSQMPPELATWEPLTSLRQQFPRAPAWGHAGSEEPGNVSNLTATPAEADPEEADGASVTQEPSAPKPTRVRRPSVRVSGPLWSK